MASNESNNTAEGSVDDTSLAINQEYQPIETLTHASSDIQQATELGPESKNKKVQSAPNKRYPNIDILQLADYSTEAPKKTESNNSNLDAETGNLDAAGGTKRGTTDLYSQYLLDISTKNRAPLPAQPEVTPTIPMWWNQNYPEYTSVNRTNQISENDANENQEPANDSYQMSAKPSWSQDPKVEIDNDMVDSELQTWEDILMQDTNSNFYGALSPYWGVKHLESAFPLPEVSYTYEDIYSVPTRDGYQGNLISAYPDAMPSFSPRQAPYSKNDEQDGIQPTYQFGQIPTHPNADYLAQQYLLNQNAYWPKNRTSDPNISQYMGFGSSELWNNDSRVQSHNPIQRNETLVPMRSNKEVTQDSNTPEDSDKRNGNDPIGTEETSSSNFENGTHSLTNQSTEDISTKTDAEESMKLNYLFKNMPWLQSWAACTTAIGEKGKVGHSIVTGTAAGLGLCSEKDQAMLLNKKAMYEEIQKAMKHAAENNHSEYLETDLTYPMVFPSDILPDFNNAFDNESNTYSTDNDKMAILPDTTRSDSVSFTNHYHELPQYYVPLNNAYHGQDSTIWTDRNDQKLPNYDDSVRNSNEPGSAINEVDYFSWTYPRFYSGYPSDSYSTTDDSGTSSTISSDPKETKNPVFRPHTGKPVTHLATHESASPHTNSTTYSSSDKSSETENDSLTSSAMELSNSFYHGSQYDNQLMPKQYYLINKTTANSEDCMEDDSLMNPSCTQIEFSDSPCDCGKKDKCEEDMGCWHWNSDNSDSSDDSEPRFARKNKTAHSAACHIKQLIKQKIEKRQVQNNVPKSNSIDERRKSIKKLKTRGNQNLGSFDITNARDAINEFVTPNNPVEKYTQKKFNRNRGEKEKTAAKKEKTAAKKEKTVAKKEKAAAKKEKATAKKDKAAAKKEKTDTNQEITVIEMTRNKEKADKQKAKTNQKKLIAKRLAGKDIAKTEITRSSENETLSPQVTQEIPDSNLPGTAANRNNKLFRRARDGDDSLLKLTIEA